MKTTLNLTVDHHPIAIERVLQVARYRGFNVIGMQLNHDNNLRQQYLQLDVRSERAIDLLVKQLAKVYHVLELSIVGQERAQPTDMQQPLPTAASHMAHGAAVQMKEAI